MLGEPDWRACRRFAGDPTAEGVRDRPAELGDVALDRRPRLSGFVIVVGVVTWKL